MINEDEKHNPKIKSNFGDMVTNFERQCCKSGEFPTFASSVSWLSSVRLSTCVYVLFHEIYSLTSL